MSQLSGPADDSRGRAKVWNRLSRRYQESLRTRLVFISITASAILALALGVLVTLVNESRVDRYNRYLSSAFGQTTSEVMHAQGVQLLQTLDQLTPMLSGTDQSTPLSTLSTRALQFLPQGILRLEIVDDEGRLVDSRGNTGNAESILFNAALRQLLRRSTSISGVMLGAQGALTPSGLVIIAGQRLESNRLLLAAVDFDIGLKRLETLFQGQAIILDSDARPLLSRWGALTDALVAGFPDQWGYLAFDLNGTLYESINSTLVDFTGLRVGSIYLLREDDGEIASERSIRLLIACLTVAGFALFAYGLSSILRNELASLSAIRSTVDALAAGDLHAPGVRTSRADEIGDIARSVERLRTASIRHDREGFVMASAQSAERAMIEAEMRRFADMLDRSERDEVSQMLERVRSAEQSAGSGSASIGAQPERSLALAFRFMSERVRGQQERLTTVLAERTADLETVRQALAERSDLYRLREELSLARDLQLSLLPNPAKLASVQDRIQLASITRPAKEVGGDSYDYQLLDGGRRLLFLVCDSSGKGVPAAMFVLSSRALASAASEALGRLDSGLTVANSALARENDALSFTTMFIGLLDLDTGLLCYSNAGHNPPLLQRAGGAIERLDQATGLVLGAMEGIPYEQAECQLAPGDTLIVYSDGITEAHDQASALFGTERLELACAAAAGASPARYIEQLLDAVDRHAADTPQFDDITLMVMRYQPAARIQSSSAAG